MRSFEILARATLRVGPLALALSMIACVGAPPSAPAASTPADSLGCAGDPGDSAKAGPSVQGLLRTVERGPLFGATIAASGIASCRLALDEGAIAVTYQSPNGNRLLVKRDERIEFTQQEAGFTVPPAEPPLAILMRAERSMFSPGGCGIDWQHPEAPDAGAAGVETTTYRGDVCNCQARIDRGIGGRIVGLSIRSSC